MTLVLHLPVGLLTVKDSVTRAPDQHATHSILISPAAGREFAVHPVATAPRQRALLTEWQSCATFPGVLPFSPTWHPGDASSALNAASREECILLLSQLIDGAHNKQRLLGTVPRVLELLRITNWDAISYFG